MVDPIGRVLITPLKRKHTTLYVVIFTIIMLVALPIAVWLDLRNLSDTTLLVQAADTGKLIDTMRNLYAQEIVPRATSNVGHTQALFNYRDVPGAIPIPATLSIELGKQISDLDGNVKYQFISDYPFKTRPVHHLDQFELDALKTLRKNPKASVIEASGSVLNRQLRMATPILMKQACVNCHNIHPLSPKTDWKVGDVRGIQEVTVDHVVTKNIFAFKYLIMYMFFLIAVGIFFIYFQRRQSFLIVNMNEKLKTSSDFFSAISQKISKYLSPQIYKSIFSGERDVTISTERKKLSIFFSDIKDFNETTERLQPEEITILLNEYLTEMSKIALEYGATIDKFIGDAILVFFGDPDTKGIKEDAKSCVLMALAMQKRLVELEVLWRQRGISKPFKVRMGINSGYCNVGNFGSNSRMDYTIIGAEANLAARLQSIAKPGGIVISYETYALVKDFIRAQPLPAIKLKGISYDIVPYEVYEYAEPENLHPTIVTGQLNGLAMMLDLNILSFSDAEEARQHLKAALSAIESYEEDRKDKNDKKD